MESPYELHLAGNPCEERVWLEDDPVWAGVHATLALAWEQRQANIIAYRVAKARGGELFMEGLEHLGGDDE